MPLSTKSATNGNTIYPPFYTPSEGAPVVEPEGEILYPFEDVSGAGDENKIRGNWSAKTDFILSCLGFAVGLGNVWRFPYYCYINGGGAFLIPYFIMLVLGALPIFLMEISLGQFASLGCLSMWKVCPLFKGVGVSMFVVSCLIAIYYNMVMAWSVFYLIASFRAKLPWSTCGNDWNTPACYVADPIGEANCTQYNGTYVWWNGTCADDTSLNITAIQPAFSTRKLPSDEYFHNYVLEITNGIDEIGSIRWQLALCLLLAWLIVFVCLFKSIKTSGKVVYVTTVAPYIILLVLFVRALTLRGAMDGIFQFITFRWERLLDAKVWGDAAVQVFFSLSNCWGGLITLASYNRFHNNAFKDVWIITIGDALSSVFCGLVTFAILGTMAAQRGIAFEDAGNKGAGLTFVVYAEALSRLPIAPLWAVLFFSMLIMLGIDTQFFVLETVVTSICDEFPERLRKNHRHVLSLFSVIFYAFGVPLCTQGGMYIFQLLDYFAASWSLLIIGFFECMAISWVYGIDNFLDNMKWMIRYYPPPFLYWKIMWKFVTPIMIMGIMLFTWLDYRPVMYDDYEFPPWANLIGWGISFLSVSAIPITALIMFCCCSSGGCVQRMREVTCPDSDWGPALAVHRAEQYPLVIPESREPIRSVGSVFVNNQHSPSPVAYSSHDRLPELDKETAI